MIWNAAGRLCAPPLMLTLSVAEGEASRQTYGSIYSARLLGFFAPQGGSE